MKVAFHFDALHHSLSSYYLHDIEKEIFSILLQHRALELSSKVFIGDIFFRSLAEGMDGDTYSDRDKLIRVIRGWLETDNLLWAEFVESIYQKIFESEIFVVCFESIHYDLAHYIHNKIANFPAYLGVLEIDESSEVHWMLYSNQIGPRYRINNLFINILYDETTEKSEDESLINRFKRLGFEKIGFEPLNGKYTIFDKYHDYKQARRIAEWKRQGGNLLAFLADGVVSRFIDACPDIGNKLWAVLRAFEQAETNEQYAQVCSSCRRILEYVTDSIFPPVKGDEKLGTTKYRNRLLAFADRERKSDTNIDLISVSTEALEEQVKKLNGLANKGVHIDSEVFREEARRCLLRTVLLLDDILSLKKDAFPIKVDLDFSDLLNNI